MAVTVAQRVVHVLHPRWRIIYNSADITGDIARWVTEVTWTERVGGQVSEMSFTVEDAGRRWQKSSYLGVNDSLQLYIGYLGGAMINCGSFTVDMFELTGPPDRMKVNGSEGWTTQPLRTKNNRLYEKMTLSQIAQAVASRHGWTADTSAVTPDVAYDNLMQFMDNDGTDLEFLRRIANEHNYEVQIKPPKVIFYSRPALEGQAAAGTIVRQNVKHFRFTWQSLQERTFGQSSIGYLWSDNKQVFTATAVVSGKAPTADSCNMVKRCENSQQASLKALAALHEFNMLGYQAEMTLPGTTRFRAGNIVNLKGWGNYDDKWLIEQAEHILRASAGGYTTKLTMRTVGPTEALNPSAAPNLRGG